MRIDDVLKAKPRQDVVTITPDAGVRELIAMLAEHNVGALIVSSDGKTVDGHRQRARRRTPPAPRRHGRQQHRRRDHDRRRARPATRTPRSTS